jgi:cytochrome c oxidase cbb3-type subunit 3
MGEQDSEIDTVTGRPTTGHDWNGIKELDTPVPRAVLIFIVVTHLFALVWWFLFPSFPLVWSYATGILGANPHAVVEEELLDAQRAQADQLSQIAALSFDEILASESLMQYVRQTGPQLFGDNCAACHGRDARGGQNYPDLTDDDWLWGGDPETIAETLRVGINTAHGETRFAQMPAFGRDEMLTGAEVRHVAKYVYSLSHPEYSTAENIDQIQAGQDVFLNNCAGCHGENAQGSTDLGAPNLTDDEWLYDGDLDTIITTIHEGREGHMPTWDERLTPQEIKILALHVHGLGRSNE